ncbi:hypothetical protein BDZ89DRAFT_1063894 [Hymenopellis radicata]|nr:hypothetical protein BDZ89DRAFT_1063894 [Hymenopellis radicata]
MHPTAVLFQSSVTELEALNFDGVVDYFTDDVEEYYKVMKGGFLNAWFAPGELKFVFDEVYELKKLENAVVILAHSDGTSKNGTPWHNEYMFIVEADASGKKINKFTEFTDSGFFKSFMAEEAKLNAGGA